MSQRSLCYDKINHEWDGALFYALIAVINYGGVLCESFKYAQTIFYVEQTYSSTLEMFINYTLGLRG